MGPAQNPNRLVSTHSRGRFQRYVAKVPSLACRTRTKEPLSNTLLTLSWSDHVTARPKIFGSLRWYAMLVSAVRGRSVTG